MTDQVSAGLQTSRIQILCGYKLFRKCIILCFDAINDIIDGGLVEIVDFH